MCNTGRPGKARRFNLCYTQLWMNAPRTDIAAPSLVLRAPEDGTVLADVTRS